MLFKIIGQQFQDGRFIVHDQDMLFHFGANLTGRPP
jgi:hypothetical protein